MTVIYLAGPLFSAGEKAFNSSLATAITTRAPHVTVVLPQERAKSFLGKPGQNKAIFNDCIEGVLQADVIVAILDGADVDSGTAVELGYALACKKPVVGIRTDFRISEERGMNLMVAFACSKLVIDLEASVASLAETIVDFCQAILVSA